jgi:hypothetical protein
MGIMRTPGKSVQPTTTRSYYSRVVGNSEVIPLAWYDTFAGHQVPYQDFTFPGRLPGTESN